MIDTSLDFIIVLSRLVPGAQYRLDSSIPPHRILEWRDARPQPSVDAIQREWEVVKSEPAAGSVPSIEELYSALMALEKRVDGLSEKVV